jgi:hypothetical protein
MYRSGFGQVATAVLAPYKIPPGSPLLSELRIGIGVPPGGPLGSINCGCGLTVPAGATCPTLRADCGGVQPSPGLTLQSIPWWGWAGAAAVGLYAMRGK